MSPNPAVKVTILYSGGYFKTVHLWCGTIHLLNLLQCNVPLTGVPLAIAAPLVMIMVCYTTDNTRKVRLEQYNNHSYMLAVPNVKAIGLQ